MSDNPFLLPPGGAKPEAPPPAAPEPVHDGAGDGAGTGTDDSAGAAAAAAPSHYIAVPASVESVTHRVARPAQEPPAEPASEPAFEPSAAGAAVADAPAEETRVAPPRRWGLMLPDGTRVSLDAPVLLGRDPARIADQPDAGLLPVADSGKTVSKTHALLEPTADGVQVRDLHSTNGVAIDTAAGRQVLESGGRGIAPAGATVMLGSFAVGIDG